MRLTPLSMFTGRRTIFCAGFLVIASGVVARAAVITTVAGTGTSGFSGDGGAAVAAMLNQPYGVAADAAGNVVVADVVNHRIRRIDAQGVITTIAGTGTPGFSGDGGPATSSQVGAPYDVAFDTSGQLLIVDSGNNRVRVVGSTGTISTLAGNGTLASLGDGGPATAASLNGPGSIAVDSVGNYYIGETGRVRKVNPAGIISTIAGDGTSSYSGDGGPATSATFGSVRGLAADKAGNIYIADGSNRIRKIDTFGIITTVAGNGTAGFSGDGGPATAAAIHAPTGIAADRFGELFFTDRFNTRIRKIDSSGIISTLAGTGIGGFSGDGGPATAAQLQNPTGICVDASFNLFVSDLGNDRVRSFSVAPLASANPGLRNAYVYPNPAVGGQDPTIRVSLGVANDVQITIFDANGRKVHSATVTGAPTGISGGEYYYDYAWTGSKASGAYFAVIHGHAPDGTLVRAKTKFIVVR